MRLLLFSESTKKKARHTYIYSYSDDVSTTDSLDCCQVTLIFPSVVSLLKISQSVRKNTTSPRPFIQSCDTLPKSTTLLSRNCINPSVGPCTENSVTLMMLSSWLSRMCNIISIIITRHEMYNNWYLYSDPDPIFEGMDIQPEILKELISNIKRRMTPQPVKIRARKYIHVGYRRNGITDVPISFRIGY